MTENSKNEEVCHKDNKRFVKRALDQKYKEMKIAKDRKVIPDPIDDRKFQE